MEKQRTELEETNVLIAIRQPPGDRWQLADEPQGKIHTNLTDVLEAYMQKSGFKGDYRLAPLKGDLYAINVEEVRITIEPVKKFSLYGEFGEQ
jgi:hypothetical protein